MNPDLGIAFYDDFCPDQLTVRNTKLCLRCRESGWGIVRWEAELLVEGDALFADCIGQRQ